MTVLYIKRHSEPFRKLLGENNTNDSDQIRNEKNILSVNGEELAKKHAELEELKHIDVLYTSNYVRAMSTARYICENNQINMNIEDNLGERKFGVDSKDLPQGYFKIQWQDYDYKCDNGESINDTSIRMKNCIDKIINDNKDKTICVVSHGTAMLAYFLNYCDLSTDGEIFKLSFKGETIFEGFIGLNELFKLEFDDNNLVSIKNIR
jgi:2,3-bisphosphoglycerate-dependent phosphoglycerate mutase